MRYLILGPLEVVGASGRVAVPAAKQRALLAILLLHAGSPVPGWRLLEDLWAEPPVSARKVVQTYVSKLRQVLPSGTLVTTQTGYLLDVGREDLDAARFEDLASGTAGLPPHEEATRLRSALALWRGRALEDFVDEPFAQADIARLEAMRWSTYERCFDLDLATGRHEAVLPELVRHARANPLNERLRGQLMLALYRSGRQDEALRVFREGRRLLLDQLGVDPTPELGRLQQAILRHDPALDASGAPLLQRVPAAPARAERPAPQQGPKTQPSSAPAFATTFVGRSADLQRLRSILREQGERWVTLTGPAGSGKTRLAVELARRVGPEYDDGWVFVDLTRVDTHERVVLEICAALGLHPDGPDEAVAALSALLGSREQLLVLDNFEHVLAAAALVRHLVDAAPGVAALVTSRTALGGNEREYDVTPLAVPHPAAPLGALAGAEAVALFVDRARAVRPGFTLTPSTAPVVTRLCTHLDGLPLAIELAAARVDLLSPRGLLARLDRRLDLLSTDSDTLPARHRSLRAAVDWSYHLLDDDSKTVLADLSVFSGGFTVDTAESVVSAVHGLLLDVVKRLVRANLLHPAGSPGDEPRVTMLDTIREYARALLTASGRAAGVRSAHARAYLGIAEEAEGQLRGPDQIRWLDLLQAELPNVREALAWSAAEGDPDQALLTAANLWRFWQARGLTHEARARLEELLARPDVTERPRTAGHLGVARCAFHQGDLDAVRQHVTRCLPYQRRHHDDASAGFASMLLGAATGRGGNPREGADLLREALGLARARGDAWQEASCLGYLGMVLSAQRQHQAARSALEEGLRGVRELGDVRLVGWFLIGLGRAALAAGDAAYADRRFDEAITWERRMGDAWSEAWALQGSASAALARGELATASAAAVESLRPARDAHNRAATAAALRILATVAHRGSRHTVAARLLGAAAAAYDGPPHPWTSDADGVPVVDRRALARSIGQDVVDVHCARGRALTTDEAVALAHDRRRSGPR